jgi:hypothetical protein
MTIATRSTHRSEYVIALRDEDRVRLTSGELIDTVIDTVTAITVNGRLEQIVTVSGETVIERKVPWAEHPELVDLLRKVGLVDAAIGTADWARKELDLAGVNPNVAKPKACAVLWKASGGQLSLRTLVALVDSISSDYPAFSL